MQSGMDFVAVNFRYDRLRMSMVLPVDSEKCPRNSGMSASRTYILAWIIFLALSGSVVFNDSLAADSSRFAHSNSQARYVHWIELFDTANRKITAESKLPYSPLNTCGRCHDYESISHGWHFNAFADTQQGRPSEPWVWTDVRTGTQLPLSYRRSAQQRVGVFDPRDVGLSAWEMTIQFGARFPGGGFSAQPAANQPDDPTVSPRWSLAGEIEIDCMACHAGSGSYDFESRREQISSENLAWAATAAIHIGSVQGRVSRINDDADAMDPATITMLPQVEYDADCFAADGKVFFDVLREPENNACLECHSSAQVINGVIEPGWTHDEDVHLRAGMLCVDCHRNGISHHTVRGFEGESHPTGAAISTLSCSGCHLGTDEERNVALRGGRLGSPRPLHAGLPPVHFERLSCTACHAGPIPRGESLRMLTSLGHSLGASAHRSGTESPFIQGPVFAKLDDGKIYPQRILWPAYWGRMDGSNVKPLSPNDVYDWTRKSLRVRKDFVLEVASEAETFSEKILQSLDAIQKQGGVQQAVYVSTGRVYSKGDSGLTVVSESVGGDESVRWPIAHNVRPSGWSLGVSGCRECHADGGKIFDSTVQAIGPAPGDSPSFTMASLQGIDANQRLLWNQMFGGRDSFKLLIAASLMLLAIVMMLGVGAGGAALLNRPAAIAASSSEAKQ